MKKNQLTVTEALKFARHDILNELQLVLIHIDLGDTAKARSAILHATDKMKQVSSLSLLGLPETEEWITTFDWVYSAFHKTLKTTIEPGNRKVNDSDIVSYLTYVFENIAKVLDPIIEYEVLLDVRATSLDWSICITVNNALQGKMSMPKADIDYLVVEEKTEDNLWMFTLSGQ